MPKTAMPLAAPLAAAAVGIALCSAPDAGAQSAGCTGQTLPDWMLSVPLSDSSAPVRPTDCGSVEQTPPDFSWPDHDPGARYEPTLT